MAKPDDPKNLPAKPGDGAKPAEPDILAGIADVARSQGTQININLLLQSVAKADPSDLPKELRETLEIAHEYEVKQLLLFKDRADCIIDIKRRDPDEIDKRRGNQSNRHLKYVLAACTPLAILGSAWVGGNAGNIYVAGLLATAGFAGLGILGVLASGGLLSSIDIERIFRAARQTSGSGQGRGGRRNS